MLVNLFGEYKILQNLIAFCADQILHRFRYYLFDDILDLVVDVTDKPRGYVLNDSADRVIHFATGGPTYGGLFASTPAIT